MGLKSGTSMDGIDLAIIRTDGEKAIDFGPRAFVSYNPANRQLIEEALADAGEMTERSQRPGATLEAEKLIDSLHAKAVNLFLGDHQMRPEQIDIIGYHGQTVLHRPDQKLTVQLGQGARLAKLTGIKVVWDMRANDMAHGGQGAPLIPIYHAALAACLPQDMAGQTPVAFVNIGGISNVTLVSDDLVAFDCGPGNALIDQWVQQHAGVQFDLGGLIAAEGAVLPDLVEKYLSNPYFDKPAPKSLDRNDFLPPSADTISLEDGARTLAHVSAAAIVNSLACLVEKPKLAIICGGGRHNREIMADLMALGEEVAIRIIVAEEAGFEGDFIEAEAWAYLAVRCLKGLPITFPSTTGVKNPLSGGRIADP